MLHYSSLAALIIWLFQDFLSPEQTARTNCYWGNQSPHMRQRGQITKVRREHLNICWIVVYDESWITIISPRRKIPSLSANAVRTLFGHSD